MERFIIFYDTEFTTWEGAIARNWTGPGEAREIVQIGAIRFNLDTMEELEEFSVLIAPEINPLLSDFFVSLTGITNEEVQRHGLPFEEAYRKFLRFADGAVTSCYGGDAFVMNENFGFYGMDDSFDSVNIRPWFLKEGAAYGVTEKTNSGKLAATMGAKMTAIQEHNALHDVRSICAGYRFLVGRGVKSPFYSRLN